jgi:benzylsuccinate CoA-transferase BbsF subunit
MAGPYAARVMADYGATVVKVESAKKLDLIRILPPFYRFGQPPENSASFACVNAGKQSLALDLSHPDARQVALDLVDWADVVCESFAPGAMERL